MPSKTSFFNKTVFWSDQRRFWPLTAGLALLWVLILPLTRLSQYSYERAEPSARSICLETLRLSAVAGYWIAFFFGVCFATAVFSYLMNPRATNGLHALGARRETLYATHYLAGLSAQLAAQVLAAALTVLVLGSHGAIDARAAGLMLLSLVLPTLFFYSFGVFCAMFTGQILAAPVFYLIWNLLVVGVEILVRSLAGTFLFGWAETTSPRLLAWSPLLKLISELDAGYDGARLELFGLCWLWVYAAAGLVFAALGLLVYRRRHSEATGSIVAIGWARPLFKYGVAFCAALAVGQLLYQLFFGRFSADGGSSLPGLLVCMAASGLLGYFASEMLLKKSFRVFRSGWKGAAAVAAALVLLGAALSVDLTGFEGYVPDPAEIESAVIELGTASTAAFSGSVSDAETLRLLTEYHRAIVNDKARQKNASEPYETRYDMREMKQNYGWLYVHYLMKDGSFVSRNYNGLVLYASEVSDPGSVAGALKALYNAEEVTLSRVLEETWRGSFRSVDVNVYRTLRVTGGECELIRKDNAISQERSLTGEEAQAVYEAVLRDVAAGRADTTLFTYQETLWGSIRLYAVMTIPDAAPADAPEAAEIGRTSTEFSVTVFETMTDTIEALRALGLDPLFG